MKIRRAKPTVFKATQRYYQINGVLTLVDGYIDQNPFYKATTEYRQSVMWVVNNRESVVAKIYRELRSSNVPKLGYGVTVDDVYGYIVSYYMENADKDFQKNYMGKDSGYTTAAYILSNVKNLIYKYVNEDDMSMRRFGDVASIVTGTEEVEGNQSTVHEVNVGGSEDSDEWVNKGYYLECFEYLYVITCDLLDRKQPLTPDSVFDIYFHSLTGMDEEQAQTIHKITKTQWLRYVSKIQGVNDYSEDIKAMLYELAGPVERGALTVLDVRDITL